MGELVGNRYKNTKTGTIKDVWVSERQFESASFKYNGENWKQISYELNDFGRYIYNAKSLGLELDTECYIGDLD